MDGPQWSHTSRGHSGANNPFNGAQIFHSFSESPVPEPAVLALVVAGILAMVLARTRAGSSRGAALE